MREVLPPPPVASEVLSDADLEMVCGGKQAWGVIGPIVKPILYPGSRIGGLFSMRSGGTAPQSAGGSCANGVCQ